MLEIEAGFADQPFEALPFTTVEAAVPRVAAAEPVDFGGVAPDAVGSTPVKRSEPQGAIIFSDELAEVLFEVGFTDLMASALPAYGSRGCGERQRKSCKWHCDA